MKDDSTIIDLHKAFGQGILFPDLILAVLWVLCAVACIYLPVINGSFLRPLFALPVVLFIPGYVLIAALFPERGPDPDEEDEEDAADEDDTGGVAEEDEHKAQEVVTTTQESTSLVPQQGISKRLQSILSDTGRSVIGSKPRQEPDDSVSSSFSGRSGGIDGIERLALSFGLSIAVVPLIGLALNYTPWGIRLDPIVISLVLFTLVMAAIAHYRRALLPEEERLFIPVREMFEEARGELFGGDQSPLDRALSVILIIAIVAAVATTIFVIVVPKEGEKFTEFYILGEEGMAADYPTRFFAGSPQHLTIGIGNHEYRDIRYWVETWAMNQEWVEATNSSVIHSMALLDRFEVPVADNTTEEILYNFSIADQNVNRLQLLLFNATPPTDVVQGSDRINSSYRDLHLWVDVR